MTELSISKISENQCISCIFNTPEGCIGGILDKVSAATSPADFCTLHRPHGFDIGESDIEEAFAEAREITKHKYGIIIYDDSEDPQDLEKTIASILDADYPSSRIKVIISVKEQTVLERGQDLGSLLPHYYKLMNNGIKALLTLHRPNIPLDEMETEVFKSIINASHFVDIDSGKTIDKLFFNFVNRLGENMERAIICRDEEQDVTCIPKSVARAAYFDYNDYKAMIAGLTDLSKESKTYFSYEKP